MATPSCFDRFPELSVNEHVILRDFMPADCERYFHLLSHPKVKVFIPEEFLPKNPAACSREIQFLTNLFRDKRSIYWAIATRKDNQLIGTCGFEQWFFRHNRLELAYELHPDYWGQGIASQSVKAAVDYGFNQMQVNRIDAYSLLHNISSIKLLIGLGFRQEAVLQQFRYFNGAYRDIALFRLLHAEHTRDQHWIYNLLNRWR